MNAPEGAAPREAGSLDLGHVRGLLEQADASLQSGDEAALLRSLESLIKIREQTLFRGIAKVTRELHDTMRNLHMDERLSQIAGHDIPDARTRLDYVVQMTEDAAHKTLDMVEAAQQDCESLAAHADDPDRVREIAAGLHKTLTEVTLAQGYQDLTGQIIRKVTTLVQQVEGHLVHLLQASGAITATPNKRPANDAELAGPAIPGKDAGNATSQDDVDDLLASLGV